MTDGIARERVMHGLLERQAAKYGERTFLCYRDKEFSFEKVNHAANQVASGLQRLGIRKGDKVAVVMDNCPEVLFLVFGLAKLGAIEVPANTAHKGDVLTYVLDNSDSRALVMHSHYIDRVGPALPNAPQIESVVVLEGAIGDRGAEGGESSAPLTAERIESLGKRAMEWRAIVDNEGSFQPADVIWSDPLFVMYTSGTSGLSKGVVVPHNLLLSLVERYRDWAMQITEKDCIYTYQPLFHIAAWHGAVNLALVSGARLALAPKFSPGKFWDDIRRYNCTHATYAGSVTSILFNAEPKPDDADHQLRVLLGTPTPKDIFAAFEKRFGVRVVEFYGSTETGGPPMMNQVGNYRIGSCGKLHPDYAVKLVDDDGVEVGLNTPGELLVRPLKPYSMMLGYYKMPEKTVEAWEDLWFHTGDYMRCDEDGYYWYVDRKKDAIRRRGENISSQEVEKTINAHPAVLESAVVAARSQLGEDEVLACVALAPGESLAPEDLIAYCEDRMAYFMVPRYLRVMTALPKTATLRVEKYRLRDEGITPDTWDREKAGYKLKR